jgi:YidC/Oxa1 family membrane protein insertase
MIYLAPRPAPPSQTYSEPAPQNTSPGAPAVPAGTQPTPGSDAPPLQSAAFAAVNTESTRAVVTTLRNDYIEARFTDSGGALREVALIKRNEKDRLIYPDKLGGDQPFVFNALSTDPILAFVDYPELDRNARFQRVSRTDSVVEYRATLSNGLEVTRRYELAPNTGTDTDPYQIRFETTFRNTSPQAMQPMRVSLALGTAAPTNANDPGIQLTTGFSTGEDREFIARAKLESSSGFFGIGAHGSTPYLTSAGSFV